MPAPGPALTRQSGRLDSARARRDRDRRRVRGRDGARELTFAGLDCTLIEARDRLGGRTWSRDWDGDVDRARRRLGALASAPRLGRAHARGPGHRRERRTRAVLLDAWAASGAPGRARSATRSRAAPGTASWRRRAAALPRPHDPLFAMPRSRRSTRRRSRGGMDELGLDAEECDVLAAELEGVATASSTTPGPSACCACTRSRAEPRARRGRGRRLHVRGAHARPDRRDGRAGALRAVALDAGRFARPGQRRRRGAHTQWRCPASADLRADGAAERLPHVRFDELSAAKRDAIALGQASRGIKLWLRVRGREPRHQRDLAGASFWLSDGRPPAARRRPAAGRVRARCRRRRRRGPRRQCSSALDELHPGLEIVDTTAHDWLADEFARGTWAIHRPGWYTRHHAAMREPEGGLVFAGSDLADGWSGYVDGAIESGLRAARQVQALLRQLTTAADERTRSHRARRVERRAVHALRRAARRRPLRPPAAPRRGHSHGRHRRCLRRRRGRPRRRPRARGSAARVVLARRRGRARLLRHAARRRQGLSALHVATARRRTSTPAICARPPSAASSAAASGTSTCCSSTTPTASATPRPPSGRRWPGCARPVSATRSASLPAPPTASRSTSSAASSASAT